MTGRGFCFQKNSPVGGVGKRFCDVLTFYGWEIYYAYMKPITINEYIIADPGICHGQPTFKGTRVMVWQVLDLLAAGVAAEAIMKDYFPQLTHEAIAAALKYASETIEEEQYAGFPRVAQVAVR